MAMIFPEAGEKNTDGALEVAREAVLGLGIPRVVVATTTGKTACKALEVLKPTGALLVAVTHNVGFREPGHRELSLGVLEELERGGMRVHRGTMPLRGVSKAVRGLGGFGQEELIAATLRMLGHGVKVCVEIAAMAADAGLVPPDDLIAVAGTGQGADTVCVLWARPSNAFFDIKVRRILAKPWNF